MANFLLLSVVNNFCMVKHYICVYIYTIYLYVYVYMNIPYCIMA